MAHVDVGEEEAPLFPSTRKPGDDTQFNYDEYLSKAGTGLFQYSLLLLCGLGVASDAIEVNTISFVNTTTAECDMTLTDSKKGLLNSILFVGMMVGAIFFGNSADNHGRRTTLMIGMTLNGLFGCISSFVSNFGIFLACRLISGIGVGGSIPVIFTFYSEILPKETRGKLMVILAAFWMVGTIVIAALAWGILSPVDCPRAEGDTSETWCAKIEDQTCGHINFGSSLIASWRVLTFVAGLPALIGGIGFIFTPESPRWLLMRGRSADAHRVIHKIAKTNNRSAHVADMVKFEAIAQAAQAARSPDDDEEDVIGETSADTVAILPATDSGPQPRRVVHPVTFVARYHENVRMVRKTVVHLYTNTVVLFKPPLRRNMLILCAVWYALCFGFYGLSLWLPNFYKYGGVSEDSDIYFISLLSAIANLPGNIISAWSVEAIGRARTLVISMIVSAICVFFIFFVKTTAGVTAFSCVFAAVSVGGWNALNLLSTEPFPTKQRGSAYGLLSALGRVAAILGITIFGEFSGSDVALPMIMIAATLLGGGFLSLLLPSSTAKPME
eukprot:m.357899 g.357899  ORF g.357899 m.357899 type:complete len:556 (+) comp55978_c1_seq1:140-1807(+)